METINNATAAVKNAVWGDSNTGTTTSGNSSEVHKSMIDDHVTEKQYSGRREADPMAPGAYDPDKRPEGPTSTGEQPKGRGANFTNQQGTNDKSMSNSNEPNTGFGGAGAQPSVTADPNSAQQTTHTHQGADRPNEEPRSTGSGESSATSARGGASGSGGAPGGGGGMKLPDSDGQSHGEGTGTLYEKTTGLNADGGDFDATRPGAAREAQRLMDEQGVKHGDFTKGDGGEPDKHKKWYGVDHSGFGGHGSHQNKRASASSASGVTRAEEQQQLHDDTPEKKGLGAKIKDKLHHSKDE